MFWFFLSLAFLSRESDWHRNICGGELFFPATSINHKRRAVFIKRKCYHSRLKEPRKRVQEIEPNSPTQWVGDLSSWFTEYKWTFPLQMFLVTTTYLAPVGDFDFLNVFDFLPILVNLTVIIQVDQTKTLKWLLSSHHIPYNHIIKFLLALPWKYIINNLFLWPPLLVTYAACLFLDTEIFFLNSRLCFVYCCVPSV